MHEASLMRGLMGRIEALARAEGAERVTGVSVWLGALSHMSAEHFRGHFAQSSQGTLAEGATLEIEESADPADPNALEVLLRTIEVED
jgi:hydrogenase nickel incorporation protein HypA/HybF